MSGGDNGGSATTRRRSEAVTRARVVAAGYQTERTEAEWVAHPTALDDLLRVMCGTKRYVIDAERQLARDLGAA